MSYTSTLCIKQLTVQRNPHFRLTVSELQLHKGTLLSIVGPNGSGKTTLIETILGLVKARTGKIWVNQQQITNNLFNVRYNIGYIPDDDTWFIPEITAMEYIRILSKIYAKTHSQNDLLDRYNYLAQKLNFSSHNCILSTLSHGNKKKIQIIAGLLHQPPLIIIDELRNGLDPLAIKASEDLIIDESKRGACILVATHDLSWSQRIANEVLMLSQGSVVLHRTTRAIVQTFGSVEHAFMITIRERQP